MAAPSQTWRRHGAAGGGDMLAGVRRNLSDGVLLRDTADVRGPAPTLPAAALRPYRATASEHFLLESGLPYRTPQTLG